MMFCAPMFTLEAPSTARRATLRPGVARMRDQPVERLDSMSAESVDVMLILRVLHLAIEPRYRAMRLALERERTMKNTIGVVCSTLTCLTLAVANSGVAGAQTPNAGSLAASNPDPVPVWAYPWDPDFKPPPADDEAHRLAGSAASFKWAQTRDLFFSPDWHPEDHPALPAIVATGRKPDVRACGSCHRSEGTGGPENAGLAGLPVAYFVQQIADFKSGARKSSGPQRSGDTLMAATAKAMTDAEIHEAAEYFSSLKPKQIIKVVESDAVPKTYIARLFFAKRENGGTEPLGSRIVEFPNDVEQFELRDSRSQFTAYAPIGSIAKGEALAKTGGSGATIPCAICHGSDLRGIGPIPGIAGRSPSYIVRQLYDFQQGTRAGSSAALMKPAVAKLSQEDMIALAAYISSMDP
jgi:cytochrome c553